MRYLCLIYLDEAAWQSLSSSERLALEDEQRDCIAELDGHHRLITSAVIDADGIALGRRLPWVVVDLEARDLNAAIRFAARLPFTRVGDVEVRPVFFQGEPPSASLANDPSHRRSR